MAMCSAPGPLEPVAVHWLAFSLAHFLQGLKEVFKKSLNGNGAFIDKHIEKPSLVLS